MIEAKNHFALPLLHKKRPQIKKPIVKIHYRLYFFGRGEKIRTSDPLHPMQVRYQAALRPDELQIIAELHDVLPWKMFRLNQMTPTAMALHMPFADSFYKNKTSKLNFRTMYKKRFLLADMD